MVSVVKDVRGTWLEFYAVRDWLWESPWKLYGSSLAFRNILDVLETG